MKVGRQKAEGLTIGIDGPTDRKFAQAVKDVLVAWNLSSPRGFVFHRSVLLYLYYISYGV